MALAEPPPPEEEVLVEHHRADGPDPSATAASVTVVRVDEELAAADELPQVLDRVAGASVRHLGGLGDWSAVSIRGSALRQVQVHLDGVPLNPDGAAAVNLAELPIRAFERVEVWRGAGPPELGAAPGGGVVNLVTGDRLDETHAVWGAYGSHRTARLGAFTVGPAGMGELPAQRLLAVQAFRTRGNFRYFSDNATPHNLLDDRIGVRENNDKAQIALHARYRAGTEGLRLTALGSLLGREEGLPGPVHRPAEGARLATLRNLAVGQIEGAGRRHRLEARAWGQLREERLDDPDGEIGVDRSGTRDTTATVGLQGHGRWAATHWLVPSAGVAVRRESFVARDLLRDRRQDPRLRLAATAHVAATAWAFEERLVISPAVRGLWLQDGVGGGEQAPEHTTSLDPRLGLLVRPVGWLSLKGNAARTLRPPDLTERFGDRGALKGNPALRPEQGWQWDVGARLVLPDNPVATGSLEATHFWNIHRDHIVWVQNAQRTLYPVNFGHTWVQGVEAAVALRWVEALHTTTTLAHTHSVDLSDDPASRGKRLPRVPGLQLDQRTALAVGERLRLGHHFSYTAGNHWDRTNWFLAAPRPLHGVFLKVRPVPRAPLDLEVDVLNLFDRIAEVVPRNPLDPTDPARVVQPVTDFLGYPLPGRTLLLTARWAP